MKAIPIGQSVAALVLLWVIASANVFWVGGATIYAPDKEERRDQLHHAALSGELPAGVDRWTDLGANTAAIRPAIPWLADRTASMTGLRLTRVYQLIEWVSIVIMLVLLFLILARFFPAERALIGCLYLAAVLPLSYFGHYYQPWDKPALALWLAAVGLFLADAVVPAAFVVCLAVFVKFDAIVLPALYMLLYAGRMKTGRFAARSALLWLASIAPYALLLWLRPHAAEPRDAVAQFVKNLHAFGVTWYSYPPAIGLLLPVGLGALGLSWSSRAERAMYTFALGVLAILAVKTNFLEIRAEFAPLALLLPAALHGFGRLIGADRPQGTPA